MSGLTMTPLIVFGGAAVIAVHNSVAVGSVEAWRLEWMEVAGKL